jgi:S1-C subfamily serine protease
VAAAAAACGALPAPAPDDFAATPPSSTGEPLVRAAAPAAADLAAAEKGVVRIRNVRCAGLSVGTGFALDSRTLVTNRHVIDGARELQLETFDGRSVPVTTSAAATVADVAVVRTEGELPQSLQLASADPVAGASVTIVGYPRGGARTATRGEVVGYADDPLGGSTRVFVASARVQAGNSGGPVLDDSGSVVGVVYAAEEGSGRSISVPVSVLRRLLDAREGFATLPACAS